VWFLPVFQYFFRTWPFARTRKNPRPGFAFFGFGHRQRLRSVSGRGWASGSNRGSWSVPTPGRVPGGVIGDFTPGALKRVKGGIIGGEIMYGENIFGGVFGVFGGLFGGAAGFFGGRAPGEIFGGARISGLFGVKTSGRGGVCGVFFGGAAVFVSGFSAFLTAGAGFTAVCSLPRRVGPGWVIRQS